MRRILLNSLQLNAVTINSAGERWRGSHAGAPPVVPDVPDIPEEPSDPDVDENGYIIFADPEVKRVLLAQGVGDGVGITKEAAAAYNGNMNRWFEENKNIDSFLEFKHFVNVTGLNATFRNSSIRYISSLGRIEGLNEAFVGSKLEGVVNLSSLRSISGMVFSGTQITSVESLGAITSIPYTNNYNNIGAFSHNAILNKVVLPEELTGIGRCAFYSCTSLQYINLSNVRQIGKYAFMGCASLDIVLDLPNLKTLDQGAFRASGIRRVYNLGSIDKLQGTNDYNSFADFEKCENLELVILPDTLISISTYALRNCISLQNIVCKASPPPSLGSKALTNTPIASGTGSIYVPDASVEAYKTTTNWSAYASRIFPVSQLATDNPELYAEIQEYL